MKTITILCLICCHASAFRFREVVIGPRLSWFGLPVDQAEATPFRANSESQVVLCWNYGKNKKLNLKDFRLVIDIFHSTKNMLKEVVPTTFKPATDSLRKDVPGLPENLSMCHVARLTMPEVPINKNYDYQLVLEKLSADWTWKPYSATLTLQVGGAVRDRLGKYRIVANWGKAMTNGRNFLATGVGTVVSSAMILNIPGIVVGLVVAAIGAYRMIAGPSLIWHGLPTEFSEIEPLQPLTVTRFVLCWNPLKFLRKAPAFNSNDYRFILQALKHGKLISSVSIPAEFKSAAQLDQSKFKTLPDNLENCYRAVLQMPEVEVSPETQYSMVLARRTAKGFDHVVDSLEIQAGFYTSKKSKVLVSASVSREITMSTGSTLTAIGAFSANPIVAAAGLIVMGAGMAMLWREMNAGTFIGKHVSWHGLPTKNSHEDEAWKSGNVEKAVVCWLKGRPAPTHQENERISFIFTQKLRSHTNPLGERKVNYSRLKPDHARGYRDIEDPDQCRVPDS